MEEIKYYQDIDEHKLEDDEERAKRNKQLKLQEFRKRMQDNAPLRYKFKIKYLKKNILETKDSGGAKPDIFEQEGYVIK